MNMDEIDSRKPLVLKAIPTRKRPTKLAAVLCGFSANYAAIMALMSFINGDEPLINFDRAHDDFILQNQDYFCSNGSLVSVRTLYEEFWFTLPIGNHMELAERFWKEFLEPILIRANEIRIEGDDSFWSGLAAPSVDATHGIYQGEEIDPAPFKTEIYASAIAGFDWTHKHAMFCSEQFMCQDEIARDLMRAADFIRQIILADIHANYYPKIRAYDLEQAVKKPSEQKAIAVHDPYFRINLHRPILLSENPNLRWAIFLPDDGEGENIKITYLSTRYARDRPKPDIAKFCEENPHCTYLDIDIMTLMVDRAENVQPLIAELNKIIDKQFANL